MKKVKTAMLTIPLLLMTMPTYAQSKPLVILFDDPSAHTFTLISDNTNKTYTTLDDGMIVLTDDLTKGQIQIDDETFDVTNTTINHIHLNTHPHHDTNAAKAVLDKKNESISTKNTHVHHITIDVLNHDYTPITQNKETDTIQTDKKTQDAPTKEISNKEMHQNTNNTEVTDNTTSDQDTKRVTLYLFKDGECIQSEVVQDGKVHFKDLEASDKYQISTFESGEDAMDVRVDTHVHYVLPSTETIEETNHTLAPITPHAEHHTRNSIQKFYKPNASEEKTNDKEQTKNNKEQTKNNKDRHNTKDTKTTQPIKSDREKTKSTTTKPQVKVEKPNVSPVKTYSSKPAVTDPDDRVASSSDTTANQNDTSSTSSSSSSTSEMLPSTGEAMKTLLPIAAFIALGSGLLLLFVTKRKEQ